MARDLRLHGARHRGDEAVRITTAAASRREDIAARQRRYVFSMSLRTACFVAAILLRDHPWACGVLIVAALVLPYVAVVMANAVTSRADDFALVDGAPGRQALPPGHETDPSDTMTGEPADHQDGSGRGAERPSP